jgi:hypothetical protein
MTSAWESTPEPTTAAEPEITGTPTAPGAADPLTRAAETLTSIDTLALERHPEAFSTFDELLREALDSPAHVSSG